jgi:hypothetical protein
MPVVQVQPLAALSSREHIRTGQPRCFERAIMCNLVRARAWTRGGGGGGGGGRRLQLLRQAAASRRGPQRLAWEPG